MTRKKTEPVAFPTPLIKISPKRERFVLELMVDENQVKAYVRAGYSKNKAGKDASKLAAIPGVKAYIEQCRAFLREKYAVTAERVLDELASIGFANAGTFFEFGESGVTLNESEDLTPRDLAAVKSISQTVTQYGGTIRLELHNKVQSLELMGQHLGLWEKQKAEDPAHIAYADIMRKGAGEFDKAGLKLH